MSLQVTKPAQDWLLRIALLMPAVFLTLAAVPRFVSGLAWEAAFPVPVAMSINAPQTPHAYTAAASILAHADPADGEAQIARAQAAIYAGEPSANVVPILEDGLAHAPASALGWTLLSELLSRTDRGRAAVALGLALELAPYDYFLAGRRARAGAGLWEALPDDARRDLLRQTQLLWGDKSLHKELRPLLRAPGGAMLITRAFADQPDDLRAINRMVLRERLGLSRGD
jgi:hypothetical protein